MVLLQIQILLHLVALQLQRRDQFLTDHLFEPQCDRADDLAAEFAEFPLILIPMERQRALER